MLSKKHQSLQWKVCGMRNAENILQIAALRPHFMGFIFYPLSPRYVGSDFQIPKNFPTDINRVGVFVNESSEVVGAMQQKYKLDFVQLHGDESSDYCRQLKSMGIKLIKAFSVDEHFDFTTLTEYLPVADFFLFDTKGKFYGGNGVAFSWEILKRYSFSVPFFLSGGLSNANLTEALNIKHPTLYALDINSGVELSPGMKDCNKVMEVKNIFESSINS